MYMFLCALQMGDVHPYRFRLKTVDRVYPFAVDTSGVLPSYNHSHLNINILSLLFGEQYALRRLNSSAENLMLHSNLFLTHSLSWPAFSIH